MSSMDFSLSTEEFSRRREQMVEAQLRQRGIRNQRVLAAMSKVPREKFVGPELERDAYADKPLPIGSGQTISQPFMVATMLEVLELRPSDHVLEVGGGTGYQAALLGELVAEIWTVERHAELADKAIHILQDFGYTNVHVIHGDGSLGLVQHAPYDKILVAAGAPEVPPSLVGQLATRGRLAVPVGNRTEQMLHIVRKTEVGIVTSTNVPCSFVPLVGAEGWKT